MSRQPDLLARIVGTALAAGVGWLVVAAVNREFAPWGALVGIVVREAAAPGLIDWAARSGY